MSREELRGEVQRLQARMAELEVAGAALRREAEKKDASLQELMSIFDSIDEPVYVADPQTYELLYVNQAVKDSWGDGVGQKCHLLFQGREEPCPFCTNDKIFGEYLGRPYIWEFQNEKTGHWFRCIDRAIRWPDGRMVRYEMAIDITDRKLMEESLRQTWERLELAIEGARLGTIDWDLTTGEMIPSAQLAEILGYSFDHLQSLLQTWESLVHEEDWPALKETVDAHCRGEIPAFEVEYRARTGSGQWRWLLGRAKVVERDDQGNPLRLAGTALDIHDRKTIQEELRRNEARYRGFLEKLEGVTYQATLDPEFIFIHGAVEAITGYSEDDLLSGRIGWLNLVTPEDQPGVWEVLSRLQTGQEDSIEMEYRIRRKDGTVRWIYSNVQRIRNTNGAPVVLQGVSYDVTERKRNEEALRQAHQELEARVAQRTAELAAANAALTEEIAERKQAEQALRASEETARALLNVATEGAILLELDSTIVTLNATAAERLGGSIEELIGRRCFDLMPPELAATRRAHGEKVVQTGQPVRFQDERDGRFTDTNAYPVFDAEGNVVRLAIFNRDITDMKIAEDKIHREQQLLHQLLNLQERERQLVAYEIHDGLAQELTGAIFRLQGFRELLAENPEEAWKTFDVGLNLLTQGIKEARGLITGLRPPILDELGIIAAIEYLVCESQERGGPRIEFQHDLQADRLAPSLQTAVFRMVQESLTNARHHSQSDRVRLELLEREGLLHVDVQDWGVGFDPAKIKPHRFGLEGLQERVRLLGGRMTIDSEPGQGTRLHVELPIVERSTEPLDVNLGPSLNET